MNMGTNKRAGPMSDSEVPLKATRRRFGRDEILRILAEADKVAGTGRVAEVLKRERIYRNQLNDWQKSARNGSMARTKFLPGSKRTSLAIPKKSKSSKGTLPALRKNCSMPKPSLASKKVASLMGLSLKTGPNAENG